VLLLGVLGGDPARGGAVPVTATARRYPPPPPGNAPPPPRPRGRRWTRRVDTAVLFVTPLLFMTALLLAVALPYLAVRPGPAPDACTLVASTWSCTSSTVATR
jgi:hypothetical protein